MPAAGEEVGLVAAVTGPVAMDLGQPPLAAGFGQAEGRAMWMAVPEAAVDEDRGLVFGQDEVGPAGQRAVERTIHGEAVSRTALYQWIDESKNMREKYRDRLDGLRQLANFWSGRSGTTVARTSSVGGADRARLVKFLSARTPNGLQDAGSLLEELASMKPATKPEHRSILDIAKERNWKKLPDHVRQAEWGSRLPTARSTPDPY